MTYNRSEIMKLAWCEAKDTFTRPGYAPHQLRALFVVALRKAWFETKRSAWHAQRSVESIRFDILSLENRTRLGWTGLQTLRELKQLLREALVREATSTQLAA